MVFQKTKFQKLETKQQHKKCATLLRALYEQLLQKGSVEQEKTTYETYLQWMHLPFVSIENDLKKISDRYHWHLDQAMISLKEHNLLPNIRRCDQTPKSEFGNIAIYLDNVRSAYNVGSILRTTEALRIGKVYFGVKTPFIDHPKVLKTSMGSAEIVPSIQQFSMEDLPKPWIALETSYDAVDVSEFIFPSTFTLILGNEEFGISDLFLQQTDYFIDIPVFGKKNSINVACAYAIAAKEIKKQLV